MSPRGFISFFRRPAGAFLLFLILLAVAYFIVIGFRPALPKRADQPSKTSPNKAAKPQLVETIQRKMAEFRPPQPPSDSPPAATPLPAPKKEQKPLELPSISLYAEAPQSQREEPLSDKYAPYGRLVRCELIVTVDSSSINTPIIGLVTDDVWHDGRLIIPAGTEVHGSARVDRVRERIASSGSWTLVWHSGEELNLSGIALDREKDGDNEGWAISDGSAGLRGQLLKSDDLAEIKLFAATFLSGAADALTTKQPTLFGNQIAPTLQNAPFAGAQQVLAAYAQQILNTIQRDGFYVRVPAGKQFYLYVTQTIDQGKATIGSTRLAANRFDDQNDKASDDAELRRELIRRAISTPAPSQPPAPTVNK